MNNTKIVKSIVWGTLLSFICFSSLVMKNQVQEMEKELAAINRGIRSDISSIHVLKAEWSHLNNPTRLRQLAGKHILLNPVKAEQIINYSALPFDNENGESKKIAARKNLSGYAAQYKELKKLTSATR